MVAKDKDLAMYFPSDFGPKNKLDREYVFNIINTKYPGYLEDIIMHANK